jgi:hypothetical protein
MLMDWIGTSFCEVAIDEERSDVSGRMGDKRGMATYYPQCFVTALVRGLSEGRDKSGVIFSVPSGAT